MAKKKEKASVVGVIDSEHGVMVGSPEPGIESRLQALAQESQAAGPLDLELNHVGKLVREFATGRPHDCEGEDFEMKRYNEKVAQISGVLLAAVVSIQEITGKR